MGFRCHRMRRNLRRVVTKRAPSLVWRHILHRRAQPGVATLPESCYEMYFPMMAERFFFVTLGTSFGSVISACARAEPHLHPRASGMDLMASRRTFCALSAFC